jgi:hypothetical protein
MALRKPSNKFKPMGPGLLESAYEVCLGFELREMGLRVLLKDGVSRIVNHYDKNLESQSARRKSAEDAEKI